MFILKKDLIMYVFMKQFEQNKQFDIVKFIFNYQNCIA